MGEEGRVQGGGRRMRECWVHGGKSHGCTAGESGKLVPSTAVTPIAAAIVFDVHMGLTDNRSGGL